MKRSWGQAAIRWIARFIELQCFLTLVSLPILLWWGLPISLLTFAGNLIFTPVLTAFLFIATLLFLTYLLHLPHGWLIWLLEKITAFWCSCLHYPTPSWLLPLQKPATGWCLLIVIGAVALVHLRKPACLELRALLIATYLGIVCGTLLYQQPSHAVLTLPYGNKEIIVTQKNGDLTLTDPGTLGRKPSPKSWVEYTLLPALISTYGTTTIDVVRSEKSSTRVLEALRYICELTTVKVLYITPWDKKSMSPAMARAYGKLTWIAQKKGTQIKVLRPLIYNK